MDATYTFGQWLKQRRQSLDLTQDALAEAVHCSVDLIRKIESGRRRPSRQVSELLAQHLRITREESGAFLQWARGFSAEVPTSAPESTTEPDSAEETAFPSMTGQRSSASVPLSVLPFAPTRLVGREHQLTHLRDLLWRSTTRLVTLTGPPGIGKTRLALAVAAALKDDFKDGLVYLSLVSVDDYALVPVSLSTALGIREQGSRSLLESLQDALREKQLLLVLDNFEQVIEAAPIITALLTAAQLKVLVTSRAPLHLRGEKLVVVPPLELPDLDMLPPLDKLAKIESVALFVERAQDAQDDFTLTQENARLVADICNQLDGLPLAIELAAARTRLFSLAALRARLGNPLALLTGGPRDAPLHQQTLRHSIESSYTLLSDEQQGLFRKLGIFKGPFTFEAAEEVALADLEGIEAILDQSLLRRQSGWDVGEDEVVLFSMLAPIREFAREQLEALGEGSETALRHARYCRALVLAAYPHIATASQKRWLDSLAASYGDLRSAFDWSLKGREPAIALEIAGHLWRFWYARGEFSEGRRWLEEALGYAGDNLPGLRALALNGLGILAERQTDLDAAERYLLESIALRRQLGELHDMATGLNNIGTVYYSQGKIDKAEEAYRESIALHRQLGDKEEVARTLGNLAMVFYNRGEYAQAIAILEETLAMRQELRVQASIASALNNLGLLTLLVGDYERSIEYCEEAAALDVELGDVLGKAFSLGNLGHAARKLGQFERARAALAESLSLFWKMGDKRNVAAALHRLAAVDAWSGKPARAARLFGAAEAAREVVGVPIDTPELLDYEESLTLTRDTLSEVEFNASWSVGHAMPMDDAIAYATQQPFA